MGSGCGICQQLRDQVSMVVESHFVWLYIYAFFLYFWRLLTYIYIFPSFFLHYRGARVGITGSIAKDEWTDRATGEPRSRHKVQVKHLDILESKAEAELRRGNSGRSYGGGGSSYGSGNNYDDDGGPEPAGTGGFFD